VSQSIPHQFARQVALHGRRPAIVGRDTLWTYDDLNRRAGGLAAAVAERDRGPVALLMAHDAPLIAAILGVLQAGGIYVPLDPSAPSERLADILADAEPLALITDRRHRTLAEQLAGDRVIEIESIGHGSPPVPDLETGEGSILFYTSGSTGRPKGVLHSHRSVLHNVKNHTDTLRIVPEDRLTLLSPVTAAASASAIFGALLNGACLCPFSVREQGLTALAEWMERERITVYHSVPTLFRHLLDSLGPLPELRVVKLGGEPLPVRDVERFRSRFPKCLLVNGLGITEAGGNLCHFVVRPETKLTGVMVPVGSPLPGIGLELLGEEGEIAVRGRHLPPGYWRDPEKTAVAYQLLPTGEVLYRTGDLGRWRADGALEHLGRKDSQVKVRGHRVDLAEVEAALLDLPGVQAAVVMSYESESLAAFLVASCPASELRSLLATKLPEPMVPSRFQILPELPLLPGGKIDREALLLRPAAQDVPAQDPLELQLREIWRRAFGREVGLADDFFELGGHSLTAAKIATGIQRSLSMDLPLTAFAAAPTLRKLARLLRDGGWTDASNPLVPLQTGGSRPPFFCIPGAGSDVFALLDLARHLGPDQPFYGLQPRGVDGSRQLHRTVEEMAAHFVEHLVTFRPEGPFRLGGTSFGGVVAFEMARQLQRQGREVELLVLLDSYGTDYPRPRPGWNPRRLVRWCLPVGAKEDPSRDNLRRGLREKIQRLRANLDMALTWLPGIPPVELRFLYLQEVCFRARRRYRPEPFQGRMVLFRAERQPPEDLFFADPELGWHGLATEGVEVHTVPGHHGMHIREPNVRVLVERLTPYLGIGAQSL